MAMGAEVPRVVHVLLVVGNICGSTRLATGDCFEIVDNADSSTDREKGRALQALLEAGSGEGIESSMISCEPSKGLGTDTCLGDARAKFCVRPTISCFELSARLSARQIRLILPIRFHVGVENDGTNSVWPSCDTLLIGMFAADCASDGGGAGKRP